MEELKQIFEFIKLIDQEKTIKRRTLNTDYTYENDAEHAWHMAVMVLLLSKYANEEFDQLRCISMILVHDLVEIYSGDTFCYDVEAKKSQARREIEAANKLYSQLPNDLGRYLYELWQEFDNGDTKEARFARAMDRAQPVMLNNATEGVEWKKNDIKLSQVLERNEKIKDGSKDIWNYVLNEFIMSNVEKGNIINDLCDRIKNSDVEIK